MFFEGELQFLCDILKKCHMEAHIVSPFDSIEAVVGSRLGALMGKEISDVTVEKFVGKLSEKTLYRISGELGISYACLLLPLSGPSVLFIGPYLRAPLQKEKLAELARKRGISQKNIRYLSEYFINIPVLAQGDHIFAVISSFCERIWETPSFAIVDEDSESPHPLSPISETSGFDDTLVSMRTMELRYKYENDIMEAVSLGQIHKEAQLLGAFSEPSFEKRVPDPIRNTKNYCIIMNTLLRKAAEKGGVHPIYLDSISSSFAKKIEQLASADICSQLMSDMFRSYCRLVRKHSMRDYSPAVQKTVLLIDSDLSADLSLTSLAGAQNISAGYLSSVFKKDTGKTVSEYIREKRISYASHLLATTHMQIQTVASSCGIMDVQYFSKLFKRETGMTPKEYRESIKKQ